MKQEEMVVLMLKGAIGELEPDQKAHVEATAQRIRDVVTEAGELGIVALGLVGAEEAAK